MSASRFLFKNDPSYITYTLGPAALSTPVVDTIDSYAIGQPAFMWISLPPDTYQFKLTNRYNKHQITWVEQTTNPQQGLVMGPAVPQAVQDFVANFDHAAAIAKSFNGSASYSKLPSSNYLGQSIEFRGMPREWTLEVTKGSGGSGSSSISGVAYGKVTTYNGIRETIPEPNQPPIVFFIDAQSKLLANGSRSFATFDERNDLIAKYSRDAQQAVIIAAHQNRRRSSQLQFGGQVADASQAPVKLAETGTGLLESRAELLMPPTGTVFKGAPTATAANRNAVNDPTRPLAHLDMGMLDHHQQDEKGVNEASGAGVASVASAASGASLVQAEDHPLAKADALQTQAQASKQDHVEAEPEKVLGVESRHDDGGGVNKLLVAGVVVIGLVAIFGRS